MNDLLYKSHNAPVPYPTMHHFTELCTCVHISATFLLQHGALWDICQMHCGIYEMGLIIRFGWCMTSNSKGHGSYTPYISQLLLVWRFTDLYYIQTLAYIIHSWWVIPLAHEWITWTHVFVGDINKDQPCYVSQIHCWRYLLVHCQLLKSL